MVGPILDLDIFKDYDEGVADGIRKTALKMIAAEASDDIISEYTGLSLDEITELKESVNSEV